MDANLHLALLAATRDDFDSLLADPAAVPSREALLREPPGETLVDDWKSALVWTEGHSSGIYESLAGGVSRDDSLVRDLAGLPDWARSLQVLDLGASKMGDLGPLAPLEALEVLRLGVERGADLRPLLALPGLARVCISGELDEPGRLVLAQLAERGVLVDDPAPDWAALSAPFADRNLKLAVVNALHARALPGSFPQFDEYRLDEANLARVLALPAPGAALASIEALTWDEGGLGVHHLVYAQWDGEDDTFSFRSLGGLERLTALRRLACYTRCLAASELDAAVSRGVVVFEAPFVPAACDEQHPHDLALLAALQLATHWRNDFPRNFWSWSVAERAAFLRTLPFGHQVNHGVDTHAPTVRWSAQPSTTCYPAPVLPALLCASGAPLESVALRTLDGFGRFQRTVEVLDVPLSLLASLEPLAGFVELRTLRAAVTPDADLAVLQKLPQLTHVELRGAISEDQRAVLVGLERRHVVVTR
jgi:hypothetical protein